MDEAGDEIRPRSSAALIDAIVPIGFLLLVVVLAYQVFAPVFAAILWGMLLAVICAHPYERLAGRLRGRRLLVDIIFGVILMLMLLLPAIFFAWELVTNLPAMARRLQELSNGPRPELPAWLADLPVLGPSFASAWSTGSADLAGQGPGLLSRFGGLADWVLAQVGGFGAFLFEFVLGSVLALFLLHHRFAFRAFLHKLLMRVGGRFATGLVLSAFETTRAAFTGVIAAAIAQTLLAGIALYVAGVPGLILFAGFTFLLALVQIGPLVVLIVADGILISQGSYLAAFLLAVWFLLVVMSVDNVIRPYFASRRSSVPGILIFLGTIGGFLSWGLIGVFVGPVLSSVLYEMLMAWVNGGEQSMTQTRTDTTEASAGTARSDT